MLRKIQVKNNDETRKKIVLNKAEILELGCLAIILFQVTLHCSRKERLQVASRRGQQVQGICKTATPSGKQRHGGVAARAWQERSMAA
jgi:hypothetical protein